MEKLLAVTSDVTHFPKDDSPYGSLLAGRLASQSVLSAVDIEMLGVFVEMDKDHSHVKMWKAGLKSLEDLDSASEARRSSKAPKSTEERELVEKTGMGWVEQVILRAAMAMGIVLSREQAQELGHEGDALDSAKFKQMIKASRPWYMTFVRNNDAKGLKEWLKRAVNALAVSKWSKASACLNLLTDELSELTIDQGFPQGFIDYYNEHMEMRRTLPMKSDAPIDDAILRRKVMGVRRGGEGPSEGQVEQVAGMRKENAEQMQRMQSKIDALGSQIRRATTTKERHHGRSAFQHKMLRVRCRGPLRARLSRAREEGGGQSTQGARQGGLESRQWSPIRRHCRPRLESDERLETNERGAAK